MTDSAQMCRGAQPSLTYPQASAAKIKVCAVLTTFNRREKTLQCLAALMANTGLENVELQAVLVDDASADGTTDAVAAKFPWVTIVHGGGNLFWCRGMHLAFEVARRLDPDHYLWLNDDTVLQHDAVCRLLLTERNVRQRSAGGALVVGTTVDAESGLLTYGGHRRRSPCMPTTFVQIPPGAEPLPCDTMTGNIVLIPRAVAAIVGNLDEAFEHAMGDTDYALRASRLGVGIWLGPGIFGACSGNPLAATYRDTSLPLRRRWQLMMSRKGLPWRSWLRLTRRHAGPLWLAYFVWPYARLIASGMLHSPLRRA